MIPVTGKTGIRDNVFFRNKALKNIDEFRDWVTVWAAKWTRCSNF